MKQIFCPDMAIVQTEKGQISVCSNCTIFTDDSTTVTLIKPLPFPETGKQISKGDYYIKDNCLVKATATTTVSEKTQVELIAENIPV